MQNYSLNSEDFSIDGGIILKRIKQIGSEDVDWNCLAQDRSQWWGLVIMVMNLGVP
jgi:hypothetical protein